MNTTALDVLKFPGLSVMFKTVSNFCNLACDYCYFSGCSGMNIDEVRISDEILEAFMREYMPLTAGAASFAWQGGEPLLASIGFFRKAVQLQAQYALPHTTIINAVQTNGTLINEEWARFFKQYNILVGISLDGPKEIHDKRRPLGSGAGSYEAVMRGIEWLRRYDVDFNILTVIHEDNVNQAEQLLEYYNREGFHYVQFIPAMNFKAQELGETGEFLITPKQYGDFLCRAFDVWLADGRPRTSIRTFDNLLSQHLNHPAELCTHRASCPLSIVIESNGDVFPCDFYMNAAHRLGNVMHDRLPSMLQSSTMKQFQSLKPALPEACVSCEYLSYCHGGCPRNRRWSEHEAVGTDYFCASYKQLYKYSAERMEHLANTVRKDWLRQLKQFGQPLPSRNELCFCGSGLKFKKCCGTAAVSLE